MSTDGALRLGLPGFEFTDLHEPAGLARLFADFRARLAASDAGLSGRYEAWLAGAQLAERERIPFVAALATAQSYSAHADGERGRSRARPPAGRATRS